MSAPALERTIELAGAEAKTPEVATTRVVPSVMPTELIQRLLETTARTRLPVRGESMRPMLRSGDRVTLAPLTRPASRGDVVAVRAVEGLVIRRFVEGPDDPVVGLVVAADRHGRRIVTGKRKGPMARAAASLQRRFREILRRKAG